MRSEKVTFEGTQGNLAARLDLPEGRPKAYALFAHCFTCSKDVFAASRIAAGLADLGIATLRFDFTGLGASDGEFENTNFTSNIEDLLKAVDFMRESYEAPKLLIGHSLGGAAVLAAAGKVEEAQIVATVGAPYDPDHIRHHFDQHIETINEKGEAEVKIGGRPFRVKKQFLDDIGGHDQKERIANLKKALLIFHSPTDQIVGVDNAANIFAAAKHPKSFITLDDADHLLTAREDALYVAQVIVAWARRYVKGLSTPELKSPWKPSPDHSIVAEAQSGKFLQVINANGHSLLADEPIDMGGDNLGPSPYGLLLSGLGACTAMTIRMYADRKKLPLEHVSVKLSHQKIHASDCEECDTKDGQLDDIEREIELVGDLDDETRQKLLEIADKCPVHRSLHGEVRIRTSLLKS
ncbi:MULTISPECIES: alpha/beta fold hydrolase [unclassified Iodidimonas]|jgi:putative redox protein|uniref:bifunctional alpha/beta hydrolase/OsmC family protein n=1 Tax=unclassified Iodidimonas TaxID=2626145 RepID=UPI0024832783|nr:MULTISPECIES: alpha/beta fold hydrolase [unclassified Iodidimonas]